MGVIGAWAVSSIIALACQCHSPRPWDFTNGRCISQSGLYYSIGVLNILTDVVIVALPIITMWTVQVSQQKRWLVNGLFAVRLLTVAAAIVQLGAYPQYFKHRDMTCEYTHLPFVDLSNNWRQGTTWTPVYGTRSY